MIMSKLRSHDRVNHKKFDFDLNRSFRFSKSTDGEGTAKITNNLYRSLDDEHGPSRRTDPLTSTTTDHLSGHPYLHRKTRASILTPHLTHRDRDRDRKRKRNLGTIEIDTTYSGNLGGNGIMFDIRTKNDEAVRIRSLTFDALHATDKCVVKVYTKRGSHRSFEENSTAWINIVDTVIECKGPQIDTVITSSMFDPLLSDDLIIEANSTRAVYISSHNILRYSLTSSTDEVFVEDSHVQILKGTALSTEYGNLHSPRMWNGMLTYELLTPDPPPQLPGCVGSLATPSNDSTQSYGHMFNIGSNYPGGIIIDGIEFQTHLTTTLNYEIYTIETTYKNFFNSNNWTLVASGTMTGGGAGVGTAIRGSDFAAVMIEANTNRGFYITLDTEDMRYAQSSGLAAGDIFAQNDHMSIEVGVGVANYPMQTLFYSPRQWTGRVLYRTASECPIPTYVQYIYEVQYPKDCHGDPLLKEVSEIVNSLVETFLRTNSEVKSLHEKSGNSISLLSTETINNGGLSSSCASTNGSDLCNVLETTVKIGCFSPSDIGYIKTLLLLQSAAVSDAIRNTFIIKYIGDEPIGTKTQLLLKGVKSPTIMLEEIAYLEKVIKSFLNKNINFEILTVKVINFYAHRLLIEKEDSIESVDNERSNITVQIAIGGVYRPPPHINFDSIVEDAINFNSEDLKYELASNSRDKGAEYFMNLQETTVVALLSTSNPDQVSGLSGDGGEGTLLNVGGDGGRGDTLSSAPNQAPLLGGNGDQSVLTSNAAMAIIAALVTLGLVFSSYGIYKVIRNKCKYPISAPEDDNNITKSLPRISPEGHHYVIDTTPGDDNNIIKSLPIISSKGHHSVIDTTPEDNNIMKSLPRISSKGHHYIIDTTLLDRQILLKSQEAHN